MITLEPSIGVQLVASTGAAGFTKQNATASILTYAAPNDGKLHRAIIHILQTVTSAETGGQVTYGLTGSNQPTIYTAGFGVGKYIAAGAGLPVLMLPGDTLTIQQATALTVGATTVYAEIWAA